MTETTESPPGEAEVTTTEAEEPDADSAEAEETDAKAPEEADETEGTATDEEVAEAEPQEEEEADAEADAEALESQSEVSPEHEYEPFVARFDGQSLDLPGAFVTEYQTPDGKSVRMVAIPEDAWERGRHHLAHRGTWQGRVKDLEGQVQALDPEVNEKVIQSAVLLEQFDKLLTGPPEEMEAFLQDYREHGERWRLLAENTALKKGEEFRESADQERQREEAERETAQNIEAEINPRSSQNLIRAHAKQLGIDDLTPEQQGVVAERIWRNQLLYYGRADEAVAQQYGLEVGEVYRNDDLISQDVTFLADMLRGTTGTPKPKHVKEAEANKKVLEGKKPPKVPSAKGSPQVGGEEPEIESWEDYENYIDGPS